MNPRYSVLNEQIFAARTTSSDENWKAKSDEVRRLTSQLRDQFCSESVRALDDESLRVGRGGTEDGAKSGDRGEEYSFHMVSR